MTNGMNSKYTDSISGESTDKNEPRQIEISSSLIARNTLLNFVGQAAPLLVGILAIPYVVHGLGTDRFGLLSLAWVVLGYFTIFDLGLGRATTKYVAEALGKGERNQIPQILWTAVSFQLIMGLISATVLLSITDLLVERILNIPPDLVTEAKDTFRLIALSIPIVLVTSSFRGSIEAAQRFDLVNAIIIPSGTLTFILPVLGLYLGFGLPGIVALVVLARFGALIAFMVINFRITPNLRTFSGSFALLSPLFSFGGWVMISNLVIPIFIYLDRILVGALITISAVTFYTVPYDVINRLLIIPISIASVLFPTFSSLASRNDRDMINIIVMRSTKFLLTIMVPLTVLLLIFSEDILRLWLGIEFAKESANAFRLLSIAVLLHAIGFTPSALIQGMGRPDIIAKFHLVELPIYVAVVFVLISQLGINGAALAWCLRMAWSMPVFFLICGKVAGVPLKAFSDNGTNRSFIFAAGILIPSMGLSLLGELDIHIKIFLVVILQIASLLFSWFIVFDNTDKHMIKKLILQALKCKNNLKIV